MVTDVSKDVWEKLHKNSNWAKENEPEWDRYLIVAHEHKAARWYAKMCNLNPGKWRYVSDADSLRGLRFRIVIYVPGWDRHYQAFEIKQMIDRLVQIGHLREKLISQ